MKDRIKITILGDGTIKAETDAVSAANHLNADEFLSFLAAQAGGEVTITQKGSTRTPDVHIQQQDHQAQW